jgi:hypothetical protein
MKPKIANSLPIRIFGWIILLASLMAVPVTMILVGVHYSTAGLAWNFCALAGGVLAVLVPLGWLANLTLAFKGFSK